MWQVSHACGCWASFFENVCRVWQASHDATPNPPLVALKSFISWGVLSPILWQAPQPFMPSVMAIGCQWMVGMAFMAAHASACLPLLNCLTCVSWQSAQVSGVGNCTLATSLVDWCPSPWQSAHATFTSQCRLMLQSATMLGVIFWWHSMQTLEETAAARACIGPGNTQSRILHAKVKAAFSGFSLSFMLRICS